MSHSTVLVIGPRQPDGIPANYDRILEEQLAPFDERLAVKPYREAEEIPPSYMRDEYPTEADYIAFVRSYWHGRWDAYDEWVAAGKPPLTARPSLTDALTDALTDTAYRAERAILEIEESTTAYRYIDLPDGKTITAATACDIVPPRDADDLTMLRAYHDDSLDRDEQGWFRMSTYNPQSRWDWYAVGGRWAGYFTLKTGTLAPLPDVHVNPFSEDIAREELAHFAPKMNGGHADVVLKGMVDFEAMRDAAAEKAGARWDLFQIAVAGTPAPRPWGAILDQWCPKMNGTGDRDFTDIDVARNAFGSQPRMVALRTFEVTNANGKIERPFVWLEDDDLELLQGPREVCLERARLGAVPTYAYLHDGEWNERARMGWWGLSFTDENTPSYEDWCRHVNTLIEELPDDTLLMLVDVHI